VSSILLLAALFAPPQDPAPRADPRGGWETVDVVVFQAGDEAITLRDVNRKYDSMVRALNLSVTTEAEYRELKGRSLEALVTLALEAQAGEDRDADPVGLEDRIDRFLAGRRRSQGVVDYADSLAEAGISAQGERELNRSTFYQSSFRSQGKVGPRPTRDGYVRPGELQEFYRSSAQELLGGEPSYRFQDLVVTVDQAGGVAEAQALAAELRARLLDGEDFGELHDQYGTTRMPTRGVTDLFGPESPLQDSDVTRFGRRGSVGDVSPVLVIREQSLSGQIVAYRVLRLYEKIPGAAPPPFATDLAQEALRAWADERRDEAWLGAARARLHRAAYLWPPSATPPPQPALVPPAGSGSTPDAEEL
jgi:hypothetical protein